MIGKGEAVPEATPAYRMAHCRVPCLRGYAGDGCSQHLCMSFQGGGSQRRRLADGRASTWPERRQLKVKWLFRVICDENKMFTKDDCWFSDRLVARAISFVTSLHGVRPTVPAEGIDKQATYCTLIHESWNGNVSSMFGRHVCAGSLFVFHFPARGSPVSACRGK
jgi:hypothetical protein